MENFTLTETDHNEPIETLKVELRNRVHKIYSSIFLIEHKMTDTNTESMYMHEHFDAIHKELNCIRDKIIN